MKRVASLTVAALIAAAGGADRASAVTAAVPTVGLAVTSFVVGAAAGTESAIDDTRSKWNRRLLGFGSLLLMGIDPDPATYLSGTTVIAFPEDVLQFQQLTWFGPFSDLSTGDTGPVPGLDAVQGSGFFDDVKLFVPQGPNPALDVTTAVGSGVVTVSWVADPGIQAEGASVNTFGLVFKSISPIDLQFQTTSPGSSMADLFQDTAAQSLVCIPSDELVARSCGYPNEPIGFSVTAVPEPSTYAILLSGLLLVGWRLRGRALAPQDDGPAIRTDGGCGTLAPTRPPRC